MRSPSPTVHALRLRFAVAAGNLAAFASRLAGRGQGVSIRGRVIRAIAPTALPQLLAGKRVVLITGTNGKTTSTHLLTAATRAGECGEVVTNADGANLQYGIISALSTAPRAELAVLETDERAVRDLIIYGHPEVLVILNLSRDQLDRNHEITSLARSWRETLTAAGDDGPLVVATIADPLVVWAAQGATRTVWIDTKANWTADAALCPACGTVLERSLARWHCPDCHLTQPEPQYQVDGAQIVGPDRIWPTSLQLPGSFNVGNAACVLAAARELGVDPAVSVAAMNKVEAPAGRYATMTIGDATIHLLLAKNPAGWATALPLATRETVVLAIDSQFADGQDVSWLYDVDFTPLRGRKIIATGYRALDLAVRLTYAEVEHTCVPDLMTAVEGHTGDVDVVATYTPFQHLLARKRKADQ